MAVGKRVILAARGTGFVSRSFILRTRLGSRAVERVDEPLSAGARCCRRSSTLSTAGGSEHHVYLVRATAHAARVMAGGSPLLPASNSQWR